MPVTQNRGRLPPEDKPTAPQTELTARSPPRRRSTVPPACASTQEPARKRPFGGAASGGSEQTRQPFRQGAQRKPVAFVRLFPPFSSTYGESLRTSGWTRPALAQFVRRDVAAAEDQRDLLAAHLRADAGPASGAAPAGSANVLAFSSKRRTANAHLVVAHQREIVQILPKDALRQHKRLAGGEVASKGVDRRAAKGARLPCEERGRRQLTPITVIQGVDALGDQ